MNATLSNLTKAFIGESQARNRYTFYAKIAQNEGFEQIAEVFLLTADNEREHAKWIYRLMNELAKSCPETCEITVEASAPLTLGSTAENLKSAIAGEEHEYTSMYPEYADIAENEGFPEIAKRLRAIATAEKHHMERFQKLLNRVENNTVHNKESPVYWVCRKCGYIHEGTKPPAECPSCSHPTKYFEVKCEEY